MVSASRQHDRMVGRRTAGPAARAPLAIDEKLGCTLAAKFARLALDSGLALEVTTNPPVELDAQGWWGAARAGESPTAKTVGFAYPGSNPRPVTTSETAHQLRKRGPAGRSFLSRYVSGVSPVGRCVAVVAYMWCTANGRKERRAKTVGFAIGRGEDIGSMPGHRFGSMDAQNIQAGGAAGGVSMRPGGQVKRSCRDGIAARRDRDRGRGSA